VATRLLFAPIFGIAALRLSQRLPQEDADALVRDAIDTTIAGVRAGAPTHARASMACGEAQNADAVRTA
jgi:hypothetical protein